MPPVVVDAHVYGLCGDGDIQEGVCAEAASLAGHLGLGNLVFVYDANDITIEGHPGFIAVGSSPMLGEHLCEVGIQFNDDFIEWSVSFAAETYPPACDVATELTRQSIVAAK